MADQVRETVESALISGEQVLRTVGAETEAAGAIAAEVRRRDANRFALELVGGINAGRDLIQGNMAVSAHPRGSSVLRAAVTTSASQIASERGP